MIDSLKSSPSENKRNIEAIMSEFSAVRHQVVQEGFIFPELKCITYLELAKDAFLKYYKNSFLKLSDVDLLSNLVIDLQASREYRTVVKKEEDYSQFIISSKICGSEEEGKWQKHSEGIMSIAEESKTFENDLEDIKNRCSLENLESNKRDFSKFLELYKDFNIWIYSGNGETLIKYEISGDMTERLNRGVTHPCGIDCIIDISIRGTIGDNWIPVSYKSLELYGDIQQKLYVYIEEKTKMDQKEHCIDITIFDELKNIITKIGNYTVKSGISNEVYSDRNPLKKTYPTEEIKITKKINSKNNSVKYINNLTWRQMDCFERSTALLLGHENDKYVNYYKFFISALQVYDLKDYVSRFSIQDLQKVFGYKRINIDDNTDIVKTVSRVIDAGKAVSVYFDEYYLFYTQYYLKSHTSHLAVINGYDKEKKLYSILDHNHLSIGNTSQLINYGQFYCPFEIIERVYDTLDEKSKVMVVLNDLDRVGKSKQDELYYHYINIIKYIIATEQQGYEISTIYQKMVSNDISFDVSIVDNLYKQLGKKELLVDTIVNYFCNEQENKDLIKELAFKVVSDSNILVNKYIVSLYSGKDISKKDMLDMIYTIQSNTTQLLKEAIIKAY